MAERERASILHYLRRLSAEGGVSDAELLRRFVASRDEAAFELLVWRHARLVFGVCRRVLDDLHDAEDAFQATFLALARHAGRIAQCAAIAGWLHQVAHRTALTARGRRARRGAHERLVGTAEHLPGPAAVETALENQELRGVLDEEIGRLPERFRAAVVLCYLEGKSVDEAAGLLGCPRGTVASRLARARERLRSRLSRRGLALPAALAVLSQANAVPRPLGLIPPLVAAALRYPAADSGLAPRITALTEEVLRAMFLHKLRTGVVVLIASVSLLLAGGGLALGLRTQPRPEGEPLNQTEAVQAHVADPTAQAKDEPAAAPRPVTVIQPLRREAMPYQDYTGRLEARQAVDVYPAMSGVVQKVCFKAGAEIKKGDVLFELDSRAAQLALEKAKLDLVSAEAKRRQVGDPAPTQLARTEAEASIRAAMLEVDRARLDLEATRVTAPMSGQAGRPLVDVGALVFRGPDRATLLTTLTSLDPIGLTFDMDERSFLRYQRLLREKEVQGVGSELRMRVRDEEGFPRVGTLESFDSQVNPQSGTVRVRGSFPNPGQLLLPGMFANVRVAFGKARAVLEVPTEVLHIDQFAAKHFVLVVGEGNVAQRRDVTLEWWIDNGMQVIEKGLRADDRVIVDSGNLQPGAKVEPRKKVAPKPSEPGQRQDP